jgi:uncharacterized protein
MRKLLLLLLFGLAVWLTWKSRRARPRASSLPPHGERMVRCAECGVYLPVSTAIESDKLHFCSSEHQRAMKR